MATQAKTYPDFSHPQSRELIWQMAEAALTPSPALERLMEPAPNPRYPGYAGLMQDARYGTDYRPHCNSNIPPPFQFGSKKWMIHNADRIMNRSRIQQAEYTGAALAFKNSEMPIPEFENVSVCTPFLCEMRDIHEDQQARIGLYREGAAAPSLFGTFMVAPTRGELALSAGKNVPLTTQYMGGRNTPRGSAHYLTGSG